VNRHLLYTLVSSVLYPAVLGTMFVAYLPLIESSGSFSSGAGVLRFLALTGLLVFFLIDYLYTQEVGPERYRLVHLVLDVLFLYVLARVFSGTATDTAWEAALPFGLALICLLFLLWDLFAGAGLPLRKANIAFDVGFTLGFGLCYLLHATAWIVLLVLAVACSAHFVLVFRGRARIDPVTSA